MYDYTKRKTVSYQSYLKEHRKVFILKIGSRNLHILKRVDDDVIEEQSPSLKRLQRRSLEYYRVSQ
jgi:hypothetical protein